MHTFRGCKIRCTKARREIWDALSPDTLPQSTAIRSRRDPIAPRFTQGRRGCCSSIQCPGVSEGNEHPRNSVTRPRALIGSGQSSHPNHHGGGGLIPSPACPNSTQSEGMKNPTSPLPLGR